MSSRKSRAFFEPHPITNLRVCKALCTRATRQKSASSHSWHDSLLYLAALSGQPPKPEGARLCAGLTAKARAES